MVCNVYSGSTQIKITFFAQPLPTTLLDEPKLFVSLGKKDIAKKPKNVCVVGQVGHAKR